MKKKIGAFGAGQFSLGTLAGGRPGPTIFQNPGGGGGGGWGVSYTRTGPGRPPPWVQHVLVVGHTGVWPWGGWDAESHAQHTSNPGTRLDTSYQSTRTLCLRENRTCGLAQSSLFCLHRLNAWPCFRTIVRSKCPADPSPGAAGYTTQHRPPQRRHGHGLSLPHSIGGGMQHPMAHSVRGPCGPGNAA